MTFTFYDGPFGKVELIDSDKIVLLTWKQFCALDDYRHTVAAAFEALMNTPSANLIIDFHHGFEADREDVQWVSSTLLPELSKTSCQKVAFLADKNPEEYMEQEIVMWLSEFKKYFSVERAESYEEALRLIKLGPRTSMEWRV